MMLEMWPVSLSALMFCWDWVLVLFSLPCRGGKWLCSDWHAVRLKLKQMKRQTLKLSIIICQLNVETIKLSLNNKKYVKKKRGSVRTELLALIIPFWMAAAVASGHSFGCHPVPALVALPLRKLVDKKWKKQHTAGCQGPLASEITLNSPSHLLSNHISKIPEWSPCTLPFPY